MRNEEYRRAVAALPCVCCGLDGHSQAAHANGLEWGKGMGLKSSDTAIFPLCADRPGVRGCHSAFDEGALFSKSERREITARWISWTHAAVANERDTLPPEQPTHSARCVWTAAMAVMEHEPPNVCLEPTPKAVGSKAGLGGVFGDER